MYDYVNLHSLEEGNKPECRLKCGLAQSRLCYQWICDSHNQDLNWKHAAATGFLIKYGWSWEKYHGAQTRPSECFNYA